MQKAIHYLCKCVWNREKEQANRKHLGNKLKKTKHSSKRLQSTKKLGEL